MSAVLPLETLENLPRTPASDVKKLGWRGVMEAVRREGVTLVTTHDRPDAVILPAEDYDELLQDLQLGRAQRHAQLEALRRQFDEHLKALQEPGAGRKFDSLFDKPLDPGGRVIAGKGF
ncbi:MAG: type II toxin-antitoxin system prevent-host-death family antitoxin [Pseudoxanthomonas sp.]